MRKQLILLIFSGFAYSASAQEPLTIDDIFKRSDLNPKYQRGIEWIPNSNYCGYANSDRSAYLRVNAVDNKVDTLFKPADLESQLKRIPSIHWIDGNRFTF